MAVENLNENPMAVKAKNVPGVTRALAAFVAQIDAAQIPAHTRSIMHNALIDAVGSGIYGAGLPWGRLIQEFALEQGGPAEAVVWGSKGKLISAMNAALATGTSIHGIEYDDHSRAKIHPGAVVVAAALALGQRERISGKRLLEAITAGYETMIRVSLAANPGAARMRGWHLTGTCGTFGAAAAASVILGLDAETTASALGLAGTQSAGLWAFNADGAMSKRLHPGKAAHDGIMSALLAARGFHGPRFILETDDGGFLAAMSDEMRIDEVMKDIGTAWRADGVCFKPYACCGSNHSSIDAVMAIMDEQKLKPEDIDYIVAGVSKVVNTQTGFVYRPSTVLNAQMSLRYNIAVAIMDRKAYLEQFSEERIKEPQVCNLASRVRVEIDADMDAVYPELYAGKVTIVTKDGKRHTKRVDYSKGMPENAMHRAELEDKFISLAGLAIGQPAARQVLATLATAFDAPHISGLCEQLGNLDIKTA